MWNTTEASSDSEDSSDNDYNSFSDSDDETQQTDAQRQEERRERELERQKVLEAAGLIVKQTTDARPPRPPARTKPTRKSSSGKTAVPAAEDSSSAPRVLDTERELPLLPPPSPPNQTRNLDDAFERYEAFKLQEGNSSAQESTNRQSYISNASTYASTVPPSSPRQPISPSIHSVTLPSSASVNSTESKISSLLHFLGGRTRTPGEGSLTTERKVISGPISAPSPSRENSPAFGSVRYLRASIPSR
jgi:actin cytoskeleton-regulatory complex protein PAN1